MEVCIKSKRQKEFWYLQAEAMCAWCEVKLVNEWISMCKYSKEQVEAALTQNIEQQNSLSCDLMQFCAPENRHDGDVVDVNN